MELILGKREMGLIDSLCARYKKDNIDAVPLENLKKERKKTEALLVKAEKGQSAKSPEVYAKNAAFLIELEKRKAGPGSSYFPREEKEQIYREYVEPLRPDRGGSADAYAEAVERYGRILTDADLELFGGSSAGNEAAEGTEPYTRFVLSLAEKKDFLADETFKEILGDVDTEINAPYGKTEYMDAVAKTKRAYFLMSNNTPGPEIERKRGLLDEWEKALKESTDNDACFADMLAAARMPAMFDGIVNLHKKTVSSSEYGLYARMLAEREGSGRGEAEEALGAAFRVYGITVSGAEPAAHADEEAIKKKAMEEGALIMEALDSLDKAVRGFGDILSASFEGGQKCSELLALYEKARDAAEKARGAIKGGGWEGSEFENRLLALEDRLGRLSRKPAEIGRRIRDALERIRLEPGGMFEYREALTEAGRLVNALPQGDLDDAYNALSELEETYSGIIRDHGVTAESILGECAPYMLDGRYAEYAMAVSADARYYRDITEYYEQVRKAATGFDSESPCRTIAHVSQALVPLIYVAVAIVGRDGIVSACIAAALGAAVEIPLVYKAGQPDVTKAGKAFLVSSVALVVVLLSVMDASGGLRGLLQVAYAAMLAFASATAALAVGMPIGMAMRRRKAGALDARYKICGEKPQASLRDESRFST